MADPKDPKKQPRKKAKAKNPYEKRVKARKVRQDRKRPPDEGGRR
ncbi:MAG TPA: hypothetical protein VK736_10495 [Candidatus Binatia bacterium]|nr:hypothetical protein [Candidatus Binatia bacterium]